MVTLRRRLDLAAFRELEAFAQLGTELDKATQLQLDRGYRMVELLKQPQFQPLHFADQVISIYAGNKGAFDNVPVTRVQEAEKALLQYIREEKHEIRDALMKEGQISDSTETALKAALEEFAKRWAESNKK